MLSFLTIQDTLYASPSGRDYAICGSSTKPCQTLKATVGRVPYVTISSLSVAHVLLSAGPYTADTSLIIYLFFHLPSIL